MVVVSLVNLFLKLILMVSFLMIIFLVYLPKLFSILVNHFHEIFNSCLNFFRGFYISKVCTVVLFKLISFFSISCCLDKVSTGFAAPNGFDLGLEEVLADEIGVTKVSAQEHYLELLVGLWDGFVDAYHHHRQMVEEECLGMHCQKMVV